MPFQPIDGWGLARCIRLLAGRACCCPRPDLALGAVGGAGPETSAGPGCRWRTAVVDRRDSAAPAVAGGCWMSGDGGACLARRRWTLPICIGGSSSHHLVSDAGCGGAGRSSPAASGAGGGAEWWCALSGGSGGMAAVTGLTGVRVERVSGGGGALWWTCPIGGAAWRM